MTRETDARSNASSNACSSETPDSVSTVNSTEVNAPSISAGCPRNTNRTVISRPDSSKKSSNWRLSIWRNPAHERRLATTDDVPPLGVCASFDGGSYVSNVPPSAPHFAHPTSLPPGQPRPDESASNSAWSLRTHQPSRSPRLALQ